MRSYFRHVYVDVLLGGAQLTLLAVGIVLPIPPVWRTCLSLIAAISLTAWIGVYRRLRRVEDTPTSNIASAAQGYVELSGRCHAPPGAPMLAPYSQLDCVWCRYAMDEYKGRSWTRIEQGETDGSFLLADSSGSCVVDPAGAEIITNNKQTWTQDNYRYTESKILQNS